MTQTIHPPTMIRAQLLLDRLDPRVDEPCTVPGCVHLHRTDEGVAHGVLQLQAA